MTPAGSDNRNDYLPDKGQKQLAYRSYARLSATVVEQDDKTGRLLTAIAFFLAAGTAILSIDRVRDANVAFADGTTVHLPLIFISVFLVASAVSATYLVLSTGPQESSATPYVVPSFLSYMEIAESPKRLFAHLEERNKDARPAYEWESLLRSIWEQARRAEYKQGRIMEARAAFFLGLAPLVVALVLASRALTVPADIVWDWPIACLAGGALGFVTFLALRDRARNELHTLSLAQQGNPANTFTALAVCLSPFAFFVFISSAASSSETYWVYAVLMIGQTVTATAAVVVLHRYYFRRRRQRRRGFDTIRNVFDSFHPALLTLLVLPGPLLFVLPGARHLDVWIAFVPVAITEGVRLLDTVFSIRNINDRDPFVAYRVVLARPNPSEQ